jgi:hypothetical protein
MNVTFDGPNKLCILGTGVTSFDVVDLYSDWKAWILQSDNAKYLQAFRSIGGDPLVGDQKISGYIFLMNGWKVRPQEVSHMLSVVGNLFAEDGSNPFVSTIGDYNVMIQMVTSGNSIVTTLETGSGLSLAEHDQLMAIPLTEGGLTQGEHDQLMALPLDPVRLASMVEDPYTFEQALRLMLAVLAGKSAGGNTTTLTFRDMADVKNRITAVVDEYGNRTGITRDAA